MNQVFLLTNKLFLPSPPLGVFAFLVVVLHLGPDVVKVIKQLFGLVAAPVDGNGQ